MGPTFICKSGAYQELVDEEIAPSDFGLRQCSIGDLQGGDAKENAQILSDILSGKETGPRRDIVLLNAAGAITCAGLADDMSHGLRIARELIGNGAAFNKLQQLKAAAPCN